jgi:hypothetical protein
MNNKIVPNGNFVAGSFCGLRPMFCGICIGSAGIGQIAFPVK